MSEAKQASSARYIDVKAHLLPMFYTASMRNAGMQKVDNWPMPSWDVDSAIEMMDSYGIDAHLLSLSAPGVSFLNGQKAREMARALNEFAADTISRASPAFWRLCHVAASGCGWCPGRVGVCARPARPRRRFPAKQFLKDCT